MNSTRAPILKILLVGFLIAASDTAPAAEYQCGARLYDSETDTVATCAAEVTLDERVALSTFLLPFTDCGGKFTIVAAVTAFEADAKPAVKGLRLSIAGKKIADNGKLGPALASASVSYPEFEPSRIEVGYAFGSKGDSARLICQKK